MFDDIISGAESGGKKTSKQRDVKRVVKWVKMEHKVLYSVVKRSDFMVTWNQHPNLSLQTFAMAFSITIAYLCLKKLQIRWICFHSVLFPSLSRFGRRHRCLAIVNVRLFVFSNGQCNKARVKQNKKTIIKF